VRSEQRGIGIAVIELTLTGAEAAQRRWDRLTSIDESKRYNCAASTVRRALSLEHCPVRPAGLNRAFTIDGPGGTGRFLQTAAPAWAGSAAHISV
jgi:hypothetical protein